MVNHNIKTIALYTGDKIRSTMDHLGDGKPWELNRRFTGLFLFPPTYDDNKMGRMGEVTQIHSTESFYENMREEYIFYSRPNVIAKVDLNEAFKKFVDSGADVTLIYKEQKDPTGEYINVDKLHLNKDGELINIGLNLGTEHTFNQYLGMGFMKKTVLMDLVRTATERGIANLLKEAMLLQKNKLKINTYEYKGFTQTIRNLETYYKSSMDLLNQDVYRNLFFKDGLVYTKAKDEPPTIYRDNSNVENSLIANGCVIEGVVEDSIVFRGVKVGKGAIVKNSILMQKSEVGDYAVVVNTILDKYSCIEEGVNVAGSPTIPYVLEKRGSIRRD
jgi:glucose-1-phosphate adenylyltransferase